MGIQGVIAVLATEVQQWGCPECGYRSGYSPISMGGAAVWNCGECGTTCVILAEGVTRSPIGLGDFYPELQPHPRHGIPSHGNPDKRPESGGEYFYPRGVGLDETPSCFVCGGKQGMRHNIAAFVQCKESGDRVVAMFPQGAWLDYRDYEPDRVQVKVGACNEHLPNLQKLNQLTREGTITSDMIEEARKL